MATTLDVKELPLSARLFLFRLEELPRRRNTLLDVDSIVTREAMTVVLGLGDSRMITLDHVRNLVGLGLAAIQAETVKISKN